MQNYDNFGVPMWAYAAASFSAAYHEALSRGENGTEAGILAAADEWLKIGAVKHGDEKTACILAGNAMLAIRDKKADQDENGLLDIGKAAYKKAIQ